MAHRALAHQATVRDRAGLAALADRFASCHGKRVLAGPFQGLDYAPLELAEIDAPISKLVGAYERELHPSIAEIFELRPSQVAVLGAAEGYYAVGLARALPSTVHAFELARSARRAMRRLAEYNDVTLHIHVKATSRAVRKRLRPGTVVVADIEGAEADVFDAATVAELNGSLVIVELHEHERPGVTELLSRRFAATHRRELVTSSPRRPVDYPVLACGSPREKTLAVDELRWRGGPGTWAVFRPR